MSIDFDGNWPDAPDYEEEDDYEDDDSIEIHSEVFDKDYDEVDFDGTIDDDSDEEAAEQFDY